MPECKARQAPLADVPTASPAHSGGAGPLARPARLLSQAGRSPRPAWAAAECNRGSCCSSSSSDAGARGARPGLSHSLGCGDLGHLPRVVPPPLLALHGVLHLGRDIMAARIRTPDQQRGQEEGQRYRQLQYGRRQHQSSSPQILEDESHCTLCPASRRRRIRAEAIRQQHGRTWTITVSQGQLCRVGSAKSREQRHTASGGGRAPASGLDSTGLDQIPESSSLNVKPGLKAYAVRKKGSHAAGSLEARNTKSAPQLWSLEETLDV